jgi:hypothetical protein
MAREYEVGQMTQLLQTMPPDSPVYSTILKSIIDNMNLSNREALIAQIDQAAQPSEQQMAAMQKEQERADQMHQAQIAVLAAQAAESQARANKYNEEARLEKLKLQVDLVDAATEVNNDAVDDFEKAYRIAKFDFDKKLSVADLALREKSMNQQAPRQENANGSQQSGIQRGPNGNQ